MFIEQPPRIVRWLYPQAIWRMDPSVKAVYLTFDDGPIPEMTPWVLDVLDHYGIIELVRSGAVAMTRGPRALSEKVVGSEITGR